MVLYSDVTLTIWRRSTRGCSWGRRQRAVLPSRIHSSPNLAEVWCSAQSCAWSKTEGKRAKNTHKKTVCWNKINQIVQNKLKLAEIIPFEGMNGSNRNINVYGLGVGVGYYLMSNGMACVHVHCTSCRHGGSHSANLDVLNSLWDHEVQGNEGQNEAEQECDLEELCKRGTAEGKRIWPEVPETRILQTQRLVQVTKYMYWKYKSIISLIDRVQWKINEYWN